MIESSAAIAVFVKTPGLSPVKTRLAMGIGHAAAKEFYLRSVAAVESTVAAVQSHGAAPYWAVAEREGMDDEHWKAFPAIDQGKGGLGERLSRVFSDLKNMHQAVLLIGADSPQISATAICSAVQLLQTEQNTAVLGRCHDGGFYLVGANFSLPPDVWTGIQYSTRKTAEQITTRLQSFGRVLELPSITDVDDVRDLPILESELRGNADQTNEQLAVLDWLERHVSRPVGDVP